MSERLDVITVVVGLPVLVALVVIALRRPETLRQPPWMAWVGGLVAVSSFSQAVASTGWRAGSRLTIAAYGLVQTAGAVRTYLRRRADGTP